MIDGDWIYFNMRLLFARLDTGIQYVQYRYEVLPVPGTRSKRVETIIKKMWKNDGDKDFHLLNILEE